MRTRIQSAFIIFVTLLLIVLATELMTEASTDRGTVFVIEDACYSIDEAADHLREKMKAREGVIQCYVVSDFYSEELSDQIFEQALAHTGIQNEGDYLRYQIVNYNATTAYYESDDYFYITIEYDLDYYTTAEQEAQVNEYVAELMNQIDTTASEANIIAQINSYICSNVSYDYQAWDEINQGESNLISCSAYGALMNKTAVCQGYSVLFYRLCLAAGVDTRVVTGVAEWGITQAHAWNIVAIDEEYYYVDTTWNSTGSDATEWLLKGSNDFGRHYPYDQDNAMNDGYAISDSSYEIQSDAIYTEGDYSYKIILGEAIITSYSGSEENVVIPSQLGGYKVYGIAGGAFNACYMSSLDINDGVHYLESGCIIGCLNLTSIRIGAQVRLSNQYTAHIYGSDIGDSWIQNTPNLEAFSVPINNPDLTAIDGVLYSKDISQLLNYPEGKKEEIFMIPNGVTQIASSSVEKNRYLKSVIIPETVTYIGYWAFANDTNLETIEISNGCTFIGQYAFQNTSIVTLNLPASLTTIMGGAFYDMHKLESFSVDPDNPRYYADDGILFDREIAYLVCYPAAKSETEYAVPEGISLYGSVFSGSQLRKITLPSDTTLIPLNCFDGCTNLTEVNIPSGVERIEYCAFSGTRIKYLYIPRCVTSLSTGAFIGTSFLTQVFYEGTEEEANNIAVSFALYSDNPERGLGILIDETYTQIHYSVNYDEYLEFIHGHNFTIENGMLIKYDGVGGNVVIPDEVTEIGEYAFRRCENITSITIPDSVTSIGKEAFWGCSNLTSINIPEHVTSIDMCAFAGCSGLTSIRIPFGITQIAGYVFANCTRLKSITIPDSVESIESYAFSNCDNLTIVYYYGTAEQWAAIYKWGNDILNSAKIKIICSDNQITFTLPSALTTIGPRAFANLSNVDLIVIPSTVDSIANNAFDGTDSILIVAPGSFAEEWAISNNMIFITR
ncbi:MAG: leucine-rich repeat protein [Clostridia bacterium]|nr:leucine-rich repeat protein [Clostridia bacterium]